MAWANMAASGMGSLVLNDITADRIRTMHSEVHMELGWDFIMQQDNDPKHTARARKVFLMSKTH